MRRGFILPLVILLIGAAICYYLYAKYSKSPNTATTQTAQSVYKYPNSTSWDIQPHHNVCLNPQVLCDQPVDITFETNDDWPTIYNYYKLYLQNYGWITNNTIYTSIPTSVVFTGKNCQLTLQPQKQPFSFLSDKTPSPPYKYVFSVSCS